MATRQIIVVMGPAGAGKSTVGAALARRLGVPFYEGDDYHPPSNVEKIRRGVGLSNEDRRPWIGAIAAAILAEGPERAVLACSALNEAVRRMLEAELPGELFFVLIEVPEDELLRRLAARTGHFAGPALLESQLAAMDRAPEALRVDGTQAVPSIAEAIAGHFETQSPS